VFLEETSGEEIMHKKSSLAFILTIICLIQPLFFISQPLEGMQTNQTSVIGFYTHDQMIPYQHSVSITPNATIDQEQPTHGNHSIALTASAGYYAQQFVPSQNILTTIALYLGVNGTISTQTRCMVSIGMNLYESWTTFFIDTDSIQENGSWVYIDIPPMDLLVNHSYYIICSVEHGEESGYIEWYYDINDPYPKGYSFHSIYGSEWSMIDLGKEFPDIDLCFKTMGVLNTPPEQPMKPDGPIEGRYGTSYEFSTRTNDGNEDMIWYKWEWGDGTTSDWLGPYSEGSVCSASHTWMVKGSYLVQVKAKDCWDIESTWSEALTVRMKKTRFSAFWFLPFIVSENYL